MTSHAYLVSKMIASARPPDANGSEGIVGLLTFRAWIEPGSVPEWRVRVTRLDDISSGESTSFVTARADELETALHDWLERFRAQ